MKQFATFIVFTCLISGCTVHPDYTKPNLKTPEKWYGPIPHNNQVSDLNAWWMQFSDTTLTALQNAAQKNNPSLDIALANLQASRANLSKITGRLYPSLDGRGLINESKSGNAGGSGRIESQSVSLDASWELNLFGAVTFAKRSSIAQVDAKTLDWHQARVSLAAEVATQYVQYRACAQTLAMRNQANTSQQETARISKISADAGFSAPADAALANANATSSQSTLIAQQTTCELVVKALTTLTQLPEPEVIALLQLSNDIPKPQGFAINQLPANLIKQRPDILSKERNLAAASAEIGIAKAALYPSITLNGSIGYQRTVFNGIGFNTQTWSFGPALNIPIFDGGQRRADVKVNEANFSLAMAEFKQTVQNAIQEVEETLVQLDGANKRVQLEAQAATNFKQFFDASMINWKSGGLDLLSLEEARRQYINAQESLITQQRDRVLYWIALYKAFGGDWQSQTVPTTAINLDNESH